MLNTTTAGELTFAPIGLLVPNPFRRLDEYGIQREKVDKLRESFRATDYWGNIVAHPAGDKYEIAYGHHRLIALQEEYGLEKNVEVIVRDLTNEEMIKIMARENMEEWGTSAWVELETIRAVLAAYAAGEIKLPGVPPKTNTSLILYAGAPSGDAPRSSGEHGTHPYTRLCVAQFLGWTKKNGQEPNYACDIAFKGLEMIDNGFLKEGQLRGLGRAQVGELVSGQWSIYRAHLRVAKVQAQQAKQLVEEAAKAKTDEERKAKQRKAKQFAERARAKIEDAKEQAVEFAKETSVEMQEGTASLRDVRANALKRTPLAPEHKIYQMAGIVAKVTRACSQFDREKTTGQLMRFLKQHRQELSPLERKELVQAVEALASRLTKYAKAFHS